MYLFRPSSTLDRNRRSFRNLDSPISRLITITQGYFQSLRNKRRNFASGNQRGKRTSQSQPHLKSAVDKITENLDFFLINFRPRLKNTQVGRRKRRPRRRAKFKSLKERRRRLILIRTNSCCFVREGEKGKIYLFSTFASKNHCSHVVR